jgi:hypothetical protein
MKRILLIIIFVSVVALMPIRIYAYGANVMPVMTDYSGTGVHIQDYTESGSYSVWKAFDSSGGNSGTFWGDSCCGGTPIFTLHFDTAQTIVATKWTLFEQNVNNYRNQSLHVRASNNGTDWTTIYDITDDASSNWSNFYRIYEWTNTTAYTYYKFYDDNYGTNTWLAITNIELFGSDAPTPTPTATPTPTPLPDLEQGTDATVSSHMTCTQSTATGSATFTVTTDSSNIEPLSYQLFAPQFIFNASQYAFPNAAVKCNTTSYGGNNYWATFSATRHTYLCEALVTTYNDPPSTSSTTKTIPLYGSGSGTFQVRVFEHSGNYTDCCPSTGCDGNVWAQTIIVQEIPDENEVCGAWSLSTLGCHINFKISDIKNWIIGLFAIDIDYATAMYNAVQTLTLTKVPWIYINAIATMNFSDPAIATYTGDVPDFVFNGFTTNIFDRNGTHSMQILPATTVHGSQYASIAAVLANYRTQLDMFIMAGWAVITAGIIYAVATQL